MIVFAFLRSEKLYICGYVSMDFELLHSMKLTLLYSLVKKLNISGNLCRGYSLKLQSILTRKIKMADIDNEQQSQARPDGWKMQMKFQSARWRCEF